MFRHFSIHVKQTLNLKEKLHLKYYFQLYITKITTLKVQRVHKFLDIFNLELSKKYNRYLNLVFCIIFYGLSQFCWHLNHAYVLNRFFVTWKWKILVFSKATPFLDILHVMFLEKTFLAFCSLILCKLFILIKIKHWSQKVLNKTFITTKDKNATTKKNGIQSGPNMLPSDLFKFQKHYM